MRTWVKVTIAGVAVTVLGFSALAGVTSYYFFRHLNTGQASEAETVRQFDVLRARFGARQPLVEIVNPAAADIRVNRSVHPEGRRATTIHILTWNADGDQLQSDLPLWLMRFSSLNILSQLGVAPAKFRLTVDDIERYGPGIVADYRRPGRSDVLMWTD